MQEKTFCFTRLVLAGSLIGAVACSSSTPSTPAAVPSPENTPAASGNFPGGGLPLVPVPTPAANPSKSDGGASPSVDAAPAPGDGGGTPDAAGDAYVRADGGPFGLAARPPNQTCKPPPAVDKPIEKLSATGCVDPADPKKPAASLIPYDVISPLWSDGAAKQRFMAIPDGALIHVKDCTRTPNECKPLEEGGTAPDDGHWELPVGSVLVKSFLFQNKFVETRLFVRFATEWAGYSYQWNAAQTEATLVGEFGDNQPIVNNTGAMQNWYFPARADCMTCHHEAFGFSLGTETIQMNKTFAYPGGTTANQIATLEHIGMFDAPVRPLPSLVNPTANNQAQTLEARARSYLHANCAICHRPGGEYQAIDMRFTTALKDMSICNVMPDKGELGVVGAMRLFPASPAKSVMTLRMLAKDKNAGRMPQIATSVIDTAGEKVVADWITQVVKTCP
jgi:hypothetical protein